MYIQEKYKPSCIDDIVLSDMKIKDKIKNDVKFNKNIKYIITGEHDHCRSTFQI